MKFHIVAIACFISLFTLKTTAQSKQVPLSFVNQHSIDSKILQQEVQLNIHLPETYSKSSSLHTYPVIFLLEDEFFYQITGVVKHLSSISAMPEAIIVSFPNGFKKFYAPKLYTNDSSFWSKNWEQMPFDGNPDVFANFLQKELFVYLKEQYRTADYRMILGTSLTATFALHAFSKVPDLFQAHVAVSSDDILSMGYTQNKTLIETVEESINKIPNTRRAHLYIASVDNNDDTKTTIKTSLTKLDKKLSSSSKNLKFKAKTFYDENYAGILLPAFMEAIETFFPKKKWNPDYRVFEKQPGNALDNIHNYYKKLSIEYGYDVLPKAERWNSGNSLQAIANRLLRQRRIEESITIYKLLAKYRPKSPEALSILASAYEANKDYKQALQVQQQALNVAKQYNSKQIKYYLEHKQEIELKLVELENDY